MASLLPTTSPYYFDDLRRSGHHPQRFHSIKSYLYNSHLDLELAAWQMTYLLISPKRVYKHIYQHKQTKNRWSRDDPSFAILIALLLTVAGIVWGCAFRLGTWRILKTISFTIGVEFLLMGSLIASMTWFIANRFLTHTINIHAVEQSVEWTYAFDVHCNSFVPVYLLLHVLQFFFLPLLQKSNWISLVIGNMIYCAAALWYIHGTFLGYHALPFLVHTELFLYPMILCIVLFFVSLFGFNVSRSIVSTYF